MVGRWSWLQLGIFPPIQNAAITLLFACPVDSLNSPLPLPPSTENINTKSSQNGVWHRQLDGFRRLSEVCFGFISPLQRRIYSDFFCSSDSLPPGLCTSCVCVPPKSSNLSPSLWSLYPVFAIGSGIHLHLALRSVDGRQENHQPGPRFPHFPSVLFSLSL